MDTTITNATMGIIPIKYNNDEITVLGRDLYAALEVDSNYTTWFKRMCEYGFEEGVDYIQFLSKKEEISFNSKSLKETSVPFSEHLEESELTENKNSEWKNPNPKINHQLKLDMAKEVAMIQRSEAGRKVRKYFIEVEKQYRENIKSFGEIPMSQSPQNLALIDAGQQAIVLNNYFGVHIGIARAHALNEVEKLYNVDMSNYKKLLPASENVHVEYNPTQLAEKLTEKTGTKYTARRINAKLDELGYQSKIDGEWVLTDKGKQYANAYPYERNGHTGFQILWSEDVLKEFDF